MNLLKEFQSFVQNNSLFEPNHKLLVAVSGGVDSMVLLHLLKLQKYEVSCAHVNFNLRGIESEADAQFVKNYCTQNHIPYYHKSFDTLSFKEASGKGTQEAARILRYQWFDELVQTESFNYLVTAHHANDQAETILFNLIRGAGAKGLAGILPKRDYIVRPLLFAKKQDLLDYAKEQQIVFRTDASNDSDDYSRNYIRHQILPKILQMQSGFVSNMQHHSNLMQATHYYYLKKINELEKTIVVENKNEYIIQLKELLAQEFPAFLLFEWIKKFGYNFNQCEQIIATLVNKHSGALFYSNSHKLLIDRNTLIIKEDSKSALHICVEKLPFQFEINQTKYSFSIEEFTGFEENTWWLDADKISLPLVIRPWQQGDKFAPLGLNQTQKISDYFTNKKLNLFQKESAWIMETHNQICFIGPYQIDNRFKVTINTKTYLRIKII
ncbi:MAG: tRNA lysidine(34) synthetase TilS [Bacteroidia bacterium]|nr:tRNA lysidine(34) synthetase TilS [Bacteroidia bacterium]